MVGAVPDPQPKKVKVNAMAKYEIVRSCGHEETVNLLGPIKGREFKANAESRKLCACCFRAKLAADNAAHAQASRAAGLPALTGTEKQIGWAESIRAQIAVKIDNLRTKLDAQMGVAQQAETRRNIQIGIDILDKLMSRTSAVAWIDRRFESYDYQWLVAEVKAKIDTLAQSGSSSGSGDDDQTPPAPPASSAANYPTPKASKASLGAIMRRAWAIARDAVAKFGGLIREYLSAAMAQSWAECRA